MKNILSIALFAIFCISVNAQDESNETKAEDQFKVEINIGTTTGDQQARDLYSTTIGFDFTTLTEITKDLQVGGTLGVVNFFDNESTDGNAGKNLNFSLGGTFRFFTDNDKFFIGSDVGFAIGLNGNGDDEAGFYYRPKIGMSISDCSGINVSYAVTKDVNEYSNVSIGYEFTF